MTRFPVVLSALAFLLSACCTVAAPPPPPPPPPAPMADCDANPNPVYFGWDEDTLTGAASSAIAAMASDYGDCSFSLRGHTDSSGTSAYNMGLSERRVNRVAGALASNGVSDISTSYAGESELAVETGDGVRNPDNRRVEVGVN